MEVLFVIFGFVVVAWIARLWFVDARDRIEHLESRVLKQREALDEMHAKIRALERRTAPPAAEPTPAPAAAPTTAAPPVVAPAPAKAAPPPIVKVERPVPLEVPPAPTPVAAAKPAEPEPSRPVAPPPPRKIEVPPTPAKAPVAAKKPAFDWEGLVGVKLTAAVAGVAALVAAVSFLLYAAEHGYLQPPVRVAIGVIVGVSLLVICEFKAARRYRVANAMDGAGVAILFSSFFSAHALWDLIPATPTFLLLGLVAAVAVLLSIRRDSLFIAVLGLIGGFATPALLSTGENRPVALFSYLLLLNVGLAWVAYRKRWPLLTVLSTVLTAFYQWAWVVKFLHESSLTLAMGIFLLFPAVGIVGLALGSRRELSDGSSTTFERTSLFATAMPLVFGLYLAATPAYGANTGLLFGFLGIVDAGLLAVAIARREARVHVLGAISTVLVVIVWIAQSYDPSAFGVAIVSAAALAALYAIAPAIASAVRRPLHDDGLVATYAAPCVLVLFAFLAFQNAAVGQSLLLFGTLFAVAGLIAWRAVVSAIGGVYFATAFFVLAALAGWSTHVNDETLTVSLVLYGVYGLFALAVPVLARLAGKPIEPRAGSGIVLLAGLGLLFYLALTPQAPQAIWGFAILLSILNAAIFVESAAGRMPIISIAGGVGSWIVLTAWWARAAATVGVLPSLLLVTVLSLVMLAGHAFAHRAAHDDAGAPTAPGPRFRDGLFLALGGHLFCYYVATNPAWALPPAPLFGVLAVLTLATTVVALMTGTAALHAAAVGGAAVVIAQWSGVATAAPWPIVSLIAGGVVSAYALAAMPLFARRRITAEAIPIAAAIALFVGEMTATLAAQHADALGLAPIVIGHVLNLSVLLALCSWRRWPWVASGAALMEWFVLSAFHVTRPIEGQWPGLLTLSTAIYVVFAVYPFAAERRDAKSRDPHLALIVASGGVLLFAREALLLGGLDDYVGAVPVIQATVLAVLLRQLLRLEKPDQRDMTRLAFVAGAALAFVTVAIPLQLSRQWITVGWALEGAALAWLSTRIPHKGLAFASAGLLTAVFGRLALNPAVLYYEPRGSLRIFNWYLYTYSLGGASLIVAGAWVRGLLRRLKLVDFSKWMQAAGVIVLFLLLNIEIADYFSDGPDITFRFSAGLAQDLTYTIGWLIFGVILLVSGIVVRSHAARIAALSLIAVTTFKCFLFDLSTLEGLYKVASFVGLAISLALVSVLLQRFVLAPAKAAREKEATS